VSGASRSPHVISATSPPFKSGAKGRWMASDRTRVRESANGGEVDVSVIYIAGMGRSGSTIVDQLLGARPGYFSGGELDKVWRCGVLEDWLCACREPFSSCAFWSKVRSADPALLTTEAALATVRYQDRTLSRLMYPFWWKGGRRRITNRTPPAYFHRMIRLYRAVALASGCSVIVDSSKHPGYAHLLLKSGAVSRVRLVHLVRDPRAVAYSWMHPKVDLSSPGGKPYVFGPVSAARTAATWLEWNVTTECVSRAFPGGYSRLRYEDFAADPEGSLLRLGLIDDAASEAMAQSAEHQRQAHTVFGNPARMRTGPIVVKVDERWRERMRLRDTLTVSLIAAPLLRRYGYRLRPRGDGETRTNQGTLGS
jgi:Sulfotransferase family